MDIVIKNAKIIDGSGKASYEGTVGVSDGKIVLDGAPEGQSVLYLLKEE